ncbi:MAG: DUF4190 domain-containing protein [Mycobacterium leprae]
MSDQQGGDRPSADDPWGPTAPHSSGPDQTPGGEPGPGYGAAGYPGYGAPGYSGYGPAPRTTSATAIVALVLAILSFPVCPVIFAIISLLLAKSADREIAESGGTKEGEGLVRAARIISWVNIGLVGLAALAFVIAAVVAGVGATRSG